MQHSIPNSKSCIMLQSTNLAASLRKGTVSISVVVKIFVNTEVIVSHETSCHVLFCSVQVISTAESVISSSAITLFPRKLVSE